MKTIKILANAITCIALLFTSACETEDEKVNQAPSCVIIAPTIGQEFVQGETVLISVEASDNDGLIAEVRFYIDDMGIASDDSFPFNYQWATSDVSIGNHTIKVSSFDFSGESNTDEVSIEIILGESITDSRDGQVYKIASIGNQVWLAENMNYETPNSWWYDKDSDNGDLLGRLYRWEVANNACPGGWHLPSDDEWIELEVYLGMDETEASSMLWRGTDEGKKLKSRNYWYSGGGTDEVGFGALPGGFRGEYGGFSGWHNSGEWWTATEADFLSNAYTRGMIQSKDQIFRSQNSKGRACSVRCVRD